ncbi:MAG: BNR-4 repeat-containing protein [Solirubrobacterales bacterium]
MKRAPIICSVVICAMAALAHAAGARTIAPCGSYTWFSNPRAVAFTGNTVVGYIGCDSSIALSITGTSNTRQVRIGKVAQRDDHAGPALYVRRDGRLQVFWSEHFGPHIFTRISRQRDAMHWGPRIQLDPQPGQPNGYTYVSPVRTKYGLALFFRGAGEQQAVALSRDGVHFRPARTLLANRGHRPYAVYAATPDGDIAAAYTKVHPQETAELTPVYFARIRISAGGAVRVAATATPISSSTHSGWPEDVAAGRNGRIRVLYTETISFERHVLHFVEKSRAGWHDTTVGESGRSVSPLPRERVPGRPDLGLWTELYYSAGAALDHRDPDRFFMARQLAAGYALDRVKARRRGRGFAVQSIALADKPAVTLMRPIVPLGAKAPLAVVWLAGNYGNYLAYETRLEAAR